MAHRRTEDRMRELLAYLQEEFPNVPVGLLLDKIEKHGWEVRPVPEVEPLELTEEEVQDRIRERKPHEVLNQWVETVKGWDQHELDYPAEYRMENIRPPWRCRLGFHTARRSQGCVGYCLRFGCEDFVASVSNAHMWISYVTPVPWDPDRVGGMPSPPSPGPPEPPRPPLHRPVS